MSSYRSTHLMIRNPIAEADGGQNGGNYFGAKITLNTNMDDACCYRREQNRT